MFSRSFYGPKGRVQALEHQVSRIKRAGYEILEKKGKDRGQRYWFVLKKGKRKFIAMLILEKHLTDGWVTEWRKEDDGIRRPNCPLSILAAVGQKARTGSAAEWREQATRIMSSCARRLAEDRRLRKTQPSNWVRGKQIAALVYSTREAKESFGIFSNEELESRYLEEFPYLFDLAITHASHGHSKAVNEESIELLGAGADEPCSAVESITSRKISQIF